MLKVTILGSGSSAGVPAISGGWGLCDPTNPKNRRLRPSILIEKDEVAILVDTSPDLREQLLGVGRNHLSGIIYTHEHADHMHGIDDLREVNRAMRAPLPVWAFAETLKGIAERFSYVFDPLSPTAQGHYYKPVLLPNAVEGPFNAAGLDVQSFSQDHGYGRTMGFRIGSFAYSTDVVKLGDDAFDILAGVDTWVIGCLAETPHPTHVHVDMALEWLAKVGAKRGVITHMSGKLDYDTLRQKLPPHVEPAFDGLVLECP